MRNLCFLALLAALSSCNNPPKQPSPAPVTFGPAINNLEGYPQGSPAIQAYTQYLRSLDTNNLANGHAALSEFKRLFASQPPEVCDTGFVLFWNFQHILETSDSAVGKFIDPIRLDTLASAEYTGKTLNGQEQDAQNKLWYNNFIAQEELGEFYITPGWRLANKQFSSFVSAPMKEVLAEETKEEKEGFMVDAGLVIGPGQLADRAIWWEHFLTRYPRHIYDSPARSKYNVLLFIMVSGSDNTSILEEDSAFKLTPYFDSAYHLIMDHSPDSRTNTVIRPFWQAVQSRDSATMKRIRDSVPLY